MAHMGANYRAFLSDGAIMEVGVVIVVLLVDLALNMYTIISFWSCGVPGAVGVGVGVEVKGLRSCEVISNSPIYIRN